VRGHFVQNGQDLCFERGLGRIAHAFKAGADSASSSGDLFVRRTFYPFLEVNKTQADEDRMSVRVDESGDDDFAGAIDLSDLLAVLLDPRIAKGLFGRADGDDLPADGKNSCIFDDAKFFEVETATRTSMNSG